MTRKLVLAGAAALLAFTIACGGSSDDDSSDNGSDTNSSQTDTSSSDDSSSSDDMSSDSGDDNSSDDSSSDSSDDGDRPSADELANSITSGAATQQFGNIPDDAAQCVAEAFVDSDLSDEALQAMVDQDAGYTPSAADRKALQSLLTDGNFKECVQGLTNQN